jgi:hypothetical protein
LNSLKFNVINENIGGQLLKNGTWIGGLGLLDRKVIIRKKEREREGGEREGREGGKGEGRIFL